jgi:hypothetical protein
MPYIVYVRAITPDIHNEAIMGRKSIEAQVIHKVKANPTKPNLTKRERSALSLMLARQIIADRRREQ